MAQNLDDETFPCRKLIPFLFIKTIPFYINLRARKMGPS